MGDMSTADGTGFGDISVYADPTFQPDTAPAGAGGDPFADAPPDYSSPETADTGMLPGGTDAQLTPFSPGGGFDFTDALRGAGALLAPQGRRQGWWAGGGATRRGSFFGGGSGRMPGIDTSLGTYGPSDQGGFDAFFGGGSPNAANLQGPVRGMSSAQMAMAIVRGIRLSTGMRVSERSLVGLIVRYGFGPTQAMTGASAANLLFLFMRAKGVRHHHRGPGLYTIARTLRRADGLRRRVSHILRGCVSRAAPRARHRMPYHHMRRRSRKKR